VFRKGLLIVQSAMAAQWSGGEFWQCRTTVFVMRADVRREASSKWRVAWIERSEIRDSRFEIGKLFPDVASLHPGYTELAPSPLRHARGCALRYASNSRSVSTAV
jgi:hypothetical protein